MPDIFPTEYLFFGSFPVKVVVKKQFEAVFDKMISRYFGDLQIDEPTENRNWHKRKQNKSAYFFKDNTILDILPTSVWEWIAEIHTYVDKNHLTMMKEHPNYRFRPLYRGTFRYKVMFRYLQSDDKDRIERKIEYLINPDKVLSEKFKIEPFRYTLCVLLNDVSALVLIKLAFSEHLVSIHQAVPLEELSEDNGWKCHLRNPLLLKG